MNKWWTAAWLRTGLTANHGAGPFLSACLPSWNVNISGHFVIFRNRQQAK